MHAACAPLRTRPPIELADVVRIYGPAFELGRGLRPEQRKALRDIERCRTAALGGLSADDARWVRTRKHFLFPVRVMGALFRGKMLDALERAHVRGEVDLGRVDMRALRLKSWIVYAKRPFGGPEQVLRYLGRYT